MCAGKCARAASWVIVKETGQGDTAVVMRRKKDREGNEKILKAFILLSVLQLLVVVWYNVTI